LAVIFAMISSFILSRTLVPTMAKYLLRPHAPHTDAHGTNAVLSSARNPLVRFQRRFEEGFERFRLGYRELLGLMLLHRRSFVTGFMLFVLASFALIPLLGRNFFPAVDAGQILMHARVPVGTRLEETTTRFADIQAAIRRIIPPHEIATMVDNIGIPNIIGLVYNTTGAMGAQDGDIQIALTAEHGPTAGYVKQLREQLPRQFPDTTFSFPPADIVSQILNFGAPSPIDLQIRGNNLAANFDYANLLLNKIRQVPGIADVRIQQSNKSPVLRASALCSCRCSFSKASRVFCSCPWRWQ